jgi:hypothetical protein
VAAVSLCRVAGPLQGVLSGANPTTGGPCSSMRHSVPCRAGSIPHLAQDHRRRPASIVISAGFAVGGGMAGRVFHGAGGAIPAGDLASRRLNMRLSQDGHVTVEGSKGPAWVSHARHVEAPDGGHSSRPGLERRSRLSVSEGQPVRADSRQCPRQNRPPHGVADAAGAGKPLDGVATAAPPADPAPGARRRRRNGHRQLEGGGTTTGECAAAGQAADVTVRHDPLAMLERLPADANRSLS